MNTEKIPKPPYGYMPPKLGGEGMGNNTLEDVFLREEGTWTKVFSPQHVAPTLSTLYFPRYYYTRPISPGPDHEIVGEGETVTPQGCDVTHDGVLKMERG